MLRALYSASSGMLTQQLAMDNIANNLANINTNGFKKSKIEFQDLLYSALREPGQNTPFGNIENGFQVGNGVRVGGIQVVFTDGAIMPTDNPLDLAITGDGFFQVTLPDGTTAYTREGSFKVDGEGRIVNKDGYLLKPEVKIPQGVSNISIGADGNISGIDAAGVNVQIGKIELAKFTNPAGLAKRGLNLYEETAASGAVQRGTPNTGGFGSITSGALEMSNVNAGEEMVNVMLCQRAYEINSRIIRSADEMLGMANNLLRR